MYFNLIALTFIFKLIKNYILFFVLFHIFKTKYKSYLKIQWNK